MKRKNQWLLAIACIGAGLAGALWWLESSTRPEGGAEPDTEVKTPAVIASGKPMVQTPNPGGESGLEPAASRADSVQAEAGSLPTVGDILAEPDEDYVRVAKKLSAIALNSQVPMAEREEALAHTLNLSAGNEAEVLTPLVKNPALPDELAETVLSEALNRSLAYQADLYLAALATRKSPEMQTKIREHLAFLTGGEDKGGNPADWAEPIKAAKASWPE